MARVTDELLPHENDGIQEYDNPLPLWWLLLFIGSVIWAAWYLPWYHMITDWSSDKRYQDEVAAALEKYGDPSQGGAPAVADLAAAMTDQARIEKGGAIYATNCASCHEADGSGKIGPSFLDAEWIHGYTPEEIVAVITDGVLEKGMIAWGAILGPEKITDVAAFISSLGGVAAAQAAQGEANPEDQPDEQNPAEGEPAN